MTHLRYIQNCQDYEVLCYEFGGEDIHSVIGGRLCSSKNWFLKQIQIQTCRTAKNQRLNWTLAKIYTVEQTYANVEFTVILNIYFRVKIGKMISFGKISKTEFI